jgi:hypothetical protein
MVKSWEDMTAEQKLESTRQMIEGLSARLDEVAGVIVELEKQIKGLQTRMAPQKGPSRPILKLDRV